MDDAMREAREWVMVPREPTEEMLDALARQAQKPTGWHNVYPGMYRAMLAAAPQPSAGLPDREWQPIETAPRDGTEFLAGRFVAKCRHGKSGRIRVDHWRSREAGDGYEGLGLFNEQFWPATHWMPLPAAPAILASLRLQGGKDADAR